MALYDACRGGFARRQRQGRNREDLFRPERQRQPTRGQHLDGGARGQEVRNDVSGLR